jgi:hypothetical protein
MPSCQLSKLNKLSHQLVAQEQLSKKQQTATVGATHSTQHMLFTACLSQAAESHATAYLHPHNASNSHARRSTQSDPQPATNNMRQTFTTLKPHKAASRGSECSHSVAVDNQTRQKAHGRHSFGSLSPLTSFSCVVVSSLVGPAPLDPQCLSIESPSTFHDSPRHSTAAQRHRELSCPLSRTRAHLGTGSRAPAADQNITSEHNPSEPATDTSA